MISNKQTRRAMNLVCDLQQRIAEMQREIIRGGCCINARDDLEMAETLIAEVRKCIDNGATR